jgi:hypothetical protein
MPNLFVSKAVVVVREGKSVYPEINKVFDFTPDEAGFLLAKGAPHVRMPHNEQPIEHSAPAGPAHDKAPVKRDPAGGL